MIKTISFVALLAIGLAGSQRTEASKFSWFSSNKDTTLDFDAINRYLVENLEDRDPELNLDQAAKWLEQKRAKGKKGSIVKALENLVALRTIVSPDKCNRDGFKILQHCVAGTNGLKDGPIRRVDAIVYHYAKAHVSLCFDVYPDLLSKKKAELDPEVLRQVEELKRSNRHRYHYIGQAVYPNGEFLQEYFLSPDSEIPAHISVSEAISNNGAGDPDTKYLHILEGKKDLNWAKVRDLFKKYILEPCKVYDQMIGQELYDIISLSMKISNILGVTNYGKNMDNYIGLSLCHCLQDKKCQEATIKTVQIC